MFGNIVAEVMNMNDLDELLDGLNAEQLLDVLAFVKTLKIERTECTPEVSPVLPE